MSWAAETIQRSNFRSTKADLRSHFLELDGRSIGAPGPEGWKVRKDGGVFDQFSGATITPRAVVSTVHRGLALFERHRPELLAPVTASPSTRETG